MPINRMDLDTGAPGLTMAGRASLARAPRLAPEKQWWNLPAKIAMANDIAAQERTRSIDLARATGRANAHNDAGDAMRHARWSRRMATEIDPLSAALFGAWHELEGSLPDSQYLKSRGAPAPLQGLANARQWHGQPFAEAVMDLRNNREGRLAAAQQRPINPGNLQIALDRPASTNPAYRPVLKSR